MKPVTEESVQTMATSYLKTGLKKATLYKFAYRVRNINGWSDFSDPVLIRTAIAPSKPPPPLLIEATATMMKLRFFMPVDNGGSEIT